MDLLKDTAKILFETPSFWAFATLFIFVFFRQIVRRRKRETEILDVARSRSGYSKFTFSWWGFVLEGCLVLILFSIIYLFFIPISFLFTLGVMLIVAGLLLGVWDGIKYLFKG